MVDYKNMKFIYSFFLLLLCFPLMANFKFEIERLFVLNDSDYRYLAFKKSIRKSKFYRGNYSVKKKLEKLKFGEYYLQKGETLYTVAGKMGISVGAIATASGINFFYDVKEGQRLLIPNFDGLIYTVYERRSVKSLGKEFNIKIKDIKYFNHISRSYLSSGDWIFLPGAAKTSIEQALFYGDAFIDPLPKSRISSEYGYRIHPIKNRYIFHGGIDLAANYNTPVLAAQKGVVIFTGFVKGYGNLIILVHRYGYKTYYGHLARILVKKGQKIKISALIGRVGSTGDSTGPHLHFELRRNNKRVNPKRFTALKHRIHKILIK